MRGMRGIFQNAMRHHRHKKRQVNAHNAIVFHEFLVYGIMHKSKHYYQNLEKITTMF